MDGGRETQLSTSPAMTPFRRSGANYNMLVGSDDLDPVSGAAAHRSQSCNIIPIGRDGPPGEASARCGYALDKVAEGVTAVTLERPDGGVLPDFEPGQHIVLRRREEGDDLIRCYSLTGPAVDANAPPIRSPCARWAPAGRDDVAPAACRLR